MTTNEQIYKKYLSELKMDLINRYESTNRKATGKYADDITEEITSTRMTLYGADHSFFVERGRGKGKRPPTRVIEHWIEHKQGLPKEFYEKKKQFAFLIARKIGEQGTQGSDVLETVVQDFFNNKLYKLLEELGEVYTYRITNDIVNYFKNRIR